MLIFHGPRFLKPLISTLYSKARNQLNVIRRIQNTRVLSKNKFFLIVFYPQTLIIVLLFSIFAHLNLYTQWKKIQEWTLRLLLNDFACYYYEPLEKSDSATMEIKRPNALH